MHDFKKHIDKLLSDADDCELIGNLAADHGKRGSFRRLAIHLRAVAARLKLEMIAGISSPPSERDFLREQADKCRELATSDDQAMNAELLRLACEFDQKAGLN